MKKRYCIVAVVAAMALALSACGSSDSTETTAAESTEAAEAHIYDNAEIMDVMNGSQTEKVGEASVIEASSENITIEVLEDWYFNYVAENEFNYCIIVYTDAENTGCYAANGMVETDVTLEADDSGLYTMTDDSSATMYLPSDGELAEYGG